MENRIKIFNCDDDKFKEIIAKSRSYRNVVRLILNDELLDDSTIVIRKLLLIVQVNYLMVFLDHPKSKF